MVEGDALGFSGLALELAASGAGAGVVDSELLGASDFCAPCADVWEAPGRRWVVKAFIALVYNTSQWEFIW